MGVTGTRFVNDDLHSNKNGNKNVVWRKKPFIFDDTWDEYIILQERGRGAGLFRKT